MLEKIIRNIAEVTENPDIANNINEDADLMQDIGLDSLQLVNLFLAIEDEFNIEFDFEDFDFTELNTVKKLLNYVEVKTNITKERKYGIEKKSRSIEK